MLLNAFNKNVVGEPRGAIMRAKNNIGPEHGGFEFSAETRPLADHPDIGAQRTLWGARMNEPAREILAKFEGKAELGVRKAAAFLRDELRGGPQMAAEVIAKGEAAGFNERALRRALKRLGGSSEKPGLHTGWIWELPEQAL